VTTLSTMIRRLALLAVVAALGFGAPVAFAQLSPFNQLPPAQTTPTVTVAPPSNPTADDGLETWQQILIFGGGAVLLGGIGWVIVRDARRAAPVTAGGPATSGKSARSRERERARARARAKAAKRQRRRNR
jgi:hypothetical protein